MRLQPAAIFAAFASVAVLGAIVAGLMIIGSPSEIRLRRFDEIRAGDLATISTAVSAYRNTHDSLPQKLDDAMPSAGAYMALRLKDPLGQPYEYAVKDASSYDLCAKFDRATDETVETSRYLPEFAKHGQGKQCFTLEARPLIRH